jgi:hypothetical protein
VNGKGVETMRRTLMAALAVVSIAAGGCDESLKDVAGPSPTLTPSFASIQTEIFESTDSAGRTACVQCHTNVGRNPAAGLNLTRAAAYSALVGTTSSGKPSAARVVPGDPDSSYLVQKLEGAPGIVGQRMPRTGGPYLTEGQMLIIRRWIAEGAANN